MNNNPYNYRWFKKQKINKMIMKKIKLIFNKRNLLISYFLPVFVILSMFISLNSNLKSQTNYNDLISPTASRSQKIYLREFMIEDNSITKPVNKDKKLKSSDTKGDSTIKRINKITSILERRDGEGYYLLLELEDYEQRIQIAAYNLLGKKVLDIYNGIPINDPDYRYDIMTNNLPNGVYICFVFGKNFRLQEKFVVSR